MKKMQVVRLGLVFLWLSLIFVFSAQGSDVSSGQSGSLVGGLKNTLGFSVSQFVVRKGAHIFLYLVLGVLVANAVRDYWRGWQLAVGSTVFVWAYAVSDELHQLFVPGRSGQVGDVAIDTLAGFAGVMVMLITMKLLALRKKQT